MRLLEQNRCPICDRPERRSLGRRGDRPIPDLMHGKRTEFTFTVYHCKGCRHIYCDPTPIAEHGGELYEDVDDYFSGSAKNRVEGALGFVELIERYVPTGRLLDVGCGEGFLLEAAARRGWDVVGMEPTPAFASKASSKGFEVHARYLDGTFPSDGSFDVVALTAVLEHVPDPVGVLRDSRRVLRSGGVVLLEVPNGHRMDAWLLDRLLRLRGQPWTVRTAPMQAPFHLSEFSRASVRKALEAAGFETAHLSIKPGHVPYPLPRAIRPFVRAAESLGNAVGMGLNVTAVGVRT